MKRHGKKYNESKKLIDSNKIYSLQEAVKLIKDSSYSKFDGTIEIAIKTNANPKYNDQNIRATIVLPHGTGKSKKIAVFTNEENAKGAKDAGADIVGYQDLLTDIKEGKLNFDILITEPNLIKEIASVAKILGPKGLMPSPKAGTVSTNIKQAVEEFKKGKIEYKLDKTGNIHCPVGKVSYDEEKLVENIEALIQTINTNKPSGVKGQLIKKIVIAPTMGPGIQIQFNKK